MSEDFTEELDAADDAAGKLIKLVAECGELGIFVRTGGGLDVRVIGHHGKGQAQARMLRAAADKLDDLGADSKGHTLQ